MPQIVVVNETTGMQELVKGNAGGANIRNTPVGTQLTGITSAAPGVLYGISVNASIRLYPTVAGVAAVYSSGSPVANIALDVLAGNAAILANTNARWSSWGAGAVSVDTVQQALSPQSAIAVVVTSGTWVVEVCQP